jgi:hypothetical protein
MSLRLSLSVPTLDRKVRLGKMFHYVEYINLESLYEVAQVVDPNSELGMQVMGEILRRIDALPKTTSHNSDPIAHYFTPVTNYFSLAR